MATGTGAAGAQVCPLCNAVVDGGDQLQLHYLTSCSGYDLGEGGVGGGGGGGGGGIPTPSKPPRSLSPSPPPPPPPAVMATAAPVVSTAIASAIATGGSAPGHQCLVQFMWQPLTQMSYPKVTLLTSVGSGSIELTIDPEGGYYSSDHVRVPSGTYEGQLVVGDSFVNPVKEFTVGTKDEDIVVLEFQVGTTAGGDDDVYMQPNPSFDQHQYNYGSGRGGVGGGGRHYNPSYVSTAERAGRGLGGGVGGRVGGGGGGDGVFNNIDHRQYLERDNIGYQTTPTAMPGDENYSRQLSDEGFDPAYVKPKSKSTSTAPRELTPPTNTNPLSSSAGAALLAGRGQRGGGFRASEIIGEGGGGGVGGGGGRSSATFPVNVLPVTSSSSSSPVATKRSEVTVGSSKPSGVGSSKPRIAAKFDWVGGGGGGGGAVGAGGGGGGVRRGGRATRTKEFSVDSLQMDQSDSDLVRELQEKVVQLQETLDQVTEEKEKLQQSRERVSAQWEGKIRRLKKKLGEEQGEEALKEEEVADKLDEANSQLDVLSSENTSLSARLKEKKDEMEAMEAQLKEMKNMNAALENQLTEYMDALDHQNQSVQRTIESRQKGVAEIEREMNRMTDYMKKQQIEYQEALQSLQQKVGRAEELEKENLKIHQMNLSLTGELDDYRHQTKALMTDLETKEQLITSLRASRGGGGGGGQLLASDRTQLELDSMQQKCDAWKEEVERLSPLRDEVDRLTQENSRLQQELVRVTQDSAGLARQLNSIDSSQVKSDGGRDELERKARDYDQIMDRVTELQQVRVDLENELVPLRSERASMLSENASLREGTQPEKYLKLKKSYQALSEKCVKAQKALTEESDECGRLRQRLTEERAINVKMEEMNHQLQQQLEATTDEKGLQSIRDRVERYRSEREQFKASLSQTQAELQAYIERNEQQQMTIQSLQSALEESTVQGNHQEHMAIWQDQVATLTAKLEESNKRMFQYRDERNEQRVMVKSLTEQLATLQSTIQQLQTARTYESGPLDTALLTRLHLTDETSEQTPSSPHEEQAYSPDLYSDTPSRGGGGGGGIGGGGGGGGEARGAGSAGHRRNTKGSSHSSTHSNTTKHHTRLSPTTASNFSPSSSSSGELYVEVMNRDGMTRNLVIEKPRERLNHRLKPEVIVKRKTGQYESGVLAYFGVLDGKEMAGVILHLPNGNNDGSFKDGKHYFRCTPNYGLYCPMNNIYVESHSASF